MVPRLPRHFEATVNRKYPTKNKKKKETEALNKTVLVTFVLSHNGFYFILLDFCLCEKNIKFSHPITKVGHSI